MSTVFIWLVAIVLCGLGMWQLAANKGASGSLILIAGAFCLLVAVVLTVWSWK